MAFSGLVHGAGFFDPRRIHREAASAPGLLPMLLLLPLLLLAAQVRAEDEFFDRSRDDYQLHCMGCHGEDGRGLVNKVPSLPDDLGWLLSSPEGRKFVQRVPGVSQSALGSERLAALLNWMVKVYVDPQIAGKTAPFTAQELEELRHQPLLNVTEARSRL